MHADLVLCAPVVERASWRVALTRALAAECDDAERHAAADYKRRDAVAGDLILRLQIDEGASNVEGSAPVIAGTYTDTIRIFLEPR